MYVYICLFVSFYVCMYVYTCIAYPTSCVVFSGSKLKINRTHTYTLSLSLSPSSSLCLWHTISLSHINTQ